MKLYVCITDDARLLPHFLRHYAKFGITEFHIAVPRKLADYVTGKSQGFNVRQYNSLDVEDSVIGGVAAVTAMRMETQDTGEWVTIVDLDEFVEFVEQAPQIAERYSALGCNTVCGTMYDRFAADGRPVPFDDASDLYALYPVRARLVKEILRGVDRKCVLVKGHLKSRVAHHKFHDEKPARVYLEISHFKWNDMGLDRMRNAYEKVLAKEIPWAAEYKRVLDHFDEHGRFAWETFGGELCDPRHNGPG